MPMRGDYDIRAWFARQELQQRNWHAPPTSDATRREVIKDLLLCLQGEVGEFQNRLHSGPHQLRAKPIDLPTVSHDAIDIIKYTLAIAATAGVTAEQLNETFWAVTEAVDDRWRREQAYLEDARVLVVDIDGCLADFDGGFARWLSKAHPSLDPKVNGPNLEVAKQDFYASGGFLLLEPLDGAAASMAQAKQIGLKIAIITARQKRRHKNVETDTIQWLKRHGIPYDLLVFDRDKAEAICEHVLPAKVVAAIEDRLKHAVEIAALDIPVILFTELTGLVDPRIIPVKSWTTARGEFTYRLNQLSDADE
jgi:hypothetical protein